MIDSDASNGESQTVVSAASPHDLLASGFHVAGCPMCDRKREECS